MILKHALPADCFHVIVSGVFTASDFFINTSGRLLSFAFRDLFNASFVSCWLELAEQQQDELVHALEMALQTQSLPEITQTLLNLAEFMEHTDKVCCVLKLYYVYWVGGMFNGYVY